MKSPCAESGSVWALVRVDPIAGRKRGAGVSQNLTVGSFFSKVKILLIIDVSPINENFNAVSFFIVQIETCHVMACQMTSHRI